MNIPLAYGRGHLPVEFPDDRTTIISPSHGEALPDEKAAFTEALDTPIGTRALRERVGPQTTVCITFTDITRATPNERIIPWIFEYLEAAGVVRENILLA